jgi:hypothetical protein
MNSLPALLQAHQPCHASDLWHVTSWGPSQIQLLNLEISCLPNCELMNLFFLTTYPISGFVIETQNKVRHTLNIVLNNPISVFSAEHNVFMEVIKYLFHIALCGAQNTVSKSVHWQDYYYYFYNNFFTIFLILAPKVIHHSPLLSISLEYNPHIEKCNVNL